jgi:hypothetical protein
MVTISLAERRKIFQSLFNSFVFEIIIICNGSHFAMVNSAHARFDSVSGNQTQIKMK